MVSWPPGREGGNGSSEGTWRASPKDKPRPPPPPSPVAFSSKVKMGSVWSTTGEVALQGEAVNCQLSLS